MPRDRLPFAEPFAWARGFVARHRARIAAWGGRLAPAAVFLVALGPRLWFWGQHPLDLYLVSNMAFLDARARHLLSGESAIVDTFTPVGYPALLAPIYAWSADPYPVVGLAQAILGAITAALTYAIARRITRSGPAGLAAGGVVALYLPLVMYGGFLLTETVFAFLVALFVWLVTRPGSRGVAAGLVLGAAAVVRPNLLLAFPLLAVGAIALRRASTAPGGRRGAWAAPLRALVFALPVLGAVAAHNTRVAGRPTFVATNGGVNFFLGHCACRAVTFPRGSGVGEVSGYQNRKRYTEVIASPRPAYDEPYYYRRALALLAERPALLIRAFVNVGDGLGLTDPGPWPAQPYYPGWMGHEDALRAFGRGFAWLGIVPAFAGAAWRAWRRRIFAAEEGTRVVVLAILGGMLATLYLYLGDPRMRVPFDPLIVALAVDAWWAAGHAACLRARPCARP